MGQDLPEPRQNKALWNRAAAGLILLGMAGAAFWMGRQGPSSATGSPAPSETVVRLPPVFAKDARVLQHDFLVENGTSDSLEIKDVQQSCACSKAELGKKQLAPGEKTILHVEADLHNAKGPQRLTCTLFLDNRIPFHSYTLETTAYPTVQFSVSTLLMGLVEPTASVSREFTVSAYAPTEQGLPQLAFSQTAGDKLELRTKEQQIKRLRDGVFCDERRLDLTLRPQTTPGRGAADVLVSCSWPGGRTQKNERLSVIWKWDPLESTCRHASLSIL